MFKNLNTKILASVFLLFCIIILAVVFTVPSFNKFAEALSGNYSKTTGNQLTVTEWNNLPSDFLARSGGVSSAMQGDLDMGGHGITNIGSMGSDLNMGTHKITNLGTPTANNDAATKQYVDNYGGIKDVSGVQMKIVCGESSSANWQNYADPDAVFTNVDTRVAGAAVFTTAPMYFTSILCTSGCWRSNGAQAIYNASPTGFTVYVQDYNPEIMDRILAQSWNWRIRWCGIGQ
jgi:hypothetical protein